MATRHGGAESALTRRAKKRTSSGRAKISRRRKARGASGPGRPGHRWPQRKKLIRRPVSPGHGSRRLAASGLREPLPIVRVTDACAILGYCGLGFQSLHMSFVQALRLFELAHASPRKGEKPRPATRRRIRERGSFVPPDPSFAGAARPFAAPSLDEGERRIGIYSRDVKSRAESLLTASWPRLSRPSTR